MELNGFRATIPEAICESSQGHVKIDHGKKFSVRLHNSHRGPTGCAPADVTIILNGKDVGTFRLPYGQTVVIERPANDVGCFTAYNEDSHEAASIGIDRNSNDLGLVEVRFKPGEYKQWCPPARVVKKDPCYPWEEDGHRPLFFGGDDHYFGCKSATRGSRSARYSLDSCALQSVNTDTVSCCNEPMGMGIGLSGRSDQRFITVEDLNYNEPETVIYLRLISANRNVDAPRPIRPVYSTSIPRKL